MNRTSQRLYSPDALEAWFGRLTEDWEARFSPEELLRGRNLYREGNISSTEVLVDSLIVTFRRSKDEVYTVVEWKGEAPEVRVSSDSVDLPRGLGVAALYELEELVMETLPAVPAPVQPKKELLPDDGNGRALVSEHISQPPVRGLQLRLQPSAQGMLLQAYWLPEKSGRTEPALLSNHLNDSEREQIIRLTTRLHRANFESRPKAHGFILADPAAIAGFLRDEVPRWRRYFDFEIDRKLQQWRRGVQTIQPRLRIAPEPGTDRIRFRWTFETSSGQLLGGSDISPLMRQPGGIHFLSAAGIVRIPAEAEPLLHEWRLLLDRHGEGVLPRYLIFSFLHENSVQLSMAPELENWRQGISVAEPAALGLPDYLRVYQQYGVAWMHNMLKSGCHPLLADEMGLGKTLQILHLLNISEALKEKPVLIVCPASVVPVWEAEIERFFPEWSFSVLRGGSFPDAEQPPRIWLSSYTQLRRHKAQLESIQFSHVVLDEAQYIKNPDAKVTQACMALKAERRIALTGTPIENREMDLWTLFRFLMPGLLGSRQRLVQMLKDDRDNTNRRLRAQVAPFVLRRTKDRVADDLPPKVEMVIPCQLTAVQVQEYRNYAGAALQELGAGKVLPEKTIHLFALLTRLRQICCDPGLLPDSTYSRIHSCKIEALLTRVEEALENGSKVVVFSQFTSFLARVESALREAFPAVPLFVLTGKTAERSKPVRGFTTTNGAALCLVSLKAGGTGINLQVADYVFLLDPWWNPAVEAQAVDRVHRIGQRKRVFVYRLVAKGTIEERIERLKAEKSNLFASILNDMDSPPDLLSHIDSLAEWLEYTPQEDSEG